jgi:hypothetical protein
MLGLDMNINWDNNWWGLINNGCVPNESIYVNYCREIGNFGKLDWV